MFVKNLQQKKPISNLGIIPSQKFSSQLNFPYKTSSIPRICPCVNTRGLVSFQKILQQQENLSFVKYLRQVHQFTLRTLYRNFGCIVWDTLLEHLVECSYKVDFKVCIYDEITDEELNSYGVMIGVFFVDHQIENVVSFVKLVILVSGKKRKNFF